MVRLSAGIIPRASFSVLGRMDGTAIIFSEGVFGRPEGKTANGLVRFGRRYDILGVIDSTQAGRDAGDIVPGVTRRVPIFSTLGQAVDALGRRPEYLVVGHESGRRSLPRPFTGECCATHCGWG